MRHIDFITQLLLLPAVEIHNLAQLRIQVGYESSVQITRVTAQQRLGLTLERGAMLACLGVVRRILLSLQ